MSIQQVQIKGLNHDTLNEDISELYQKVLYTGLPVETLSDLPLVNNTPNEKRYIIQDDSTYKWNAITSMWVLEDEMSTETRMKLLEIITDNQIIFSTNIQVGVPNGVASLESVRVIINGMEQYKELDYEFTLSSEEVPTLIVSWVSKDFNLETTDLISIIYDRLKKR